MPMGLSLFLSVNKYISRRSGVFIPCFTVLGRPSKAFFAVLLVVVVSVFKFHHLIFLPNLMFSVLFQSLNSHQSCSQKKAQ